MLFQSINLISLQFIYSIHTSMKTDEHIGLKMKSYTFSRKLGEGAWAKVYQVYDDKTKTTVACKIIPKRLMDETPKLKELVQTEISVLQKCNNENVIKFIDTFTTNKDVYILTEFCNGGDMEEYLNKKKFLKEDEAREFLKQILNGFRGLHQVGAMHRDFKTANILLHNGVAKIADLGFAKILANQKKLTGTILGTSVTMAPELLQGKNYGIECDIWSVGVVYYQLLTGDYPYNAINDNEILKKIRRQRPNFGTKQISDDSKDFINKCLTIDVKQRISWVAIYEHPLLVDKKNNYRNTYIGNLQSKISIGVNKNFYQHQNKQKPLYPDLPNVQPFEFEKVELQQSKQLKQIQQEIARKKQIQQAIKNYAEVYLERRNYIMLSFKYGIAALFDLTNLPINQNLYAFLICKKAYLDMNAFRNEIAAKKNIFNLGNYLSQFFKSNQYARITENIKSDYETISLYGQSFVQEIPNSNSSSIKKHLTLQNVQPDFLQVYKQELNSYAFQLFDQKDNGKYKKLSILRLMTFVCDLANGINMKAQDYDHRIETLTATQMEKAFQQKMNELYS